MSDKLAVLYLIILSINNPLKNNSGNHVLFIILDTPAMKKITIHKKQFI